MTPAISANKPTAVKIFWWLSVTTVALMITDRVWFLVFPSAHYLTTLASLPVNFREGARRADLLGALISMTMWGAPMLALAALAAFRRANWARWAFAILFLLAEWTGFLIAWKYHQLHAYMTELWRHDWLSPWQYILPILWLAAIDFAFSRNARSWFRKPIRS